jgi:hypothetical protein
MAGILKMLAVSERDILQGRVTGKLADGRLLIDTGGETVRARTVDLSLHVGEQAVVARSKEGLTVVGRRLQKKRERHVVRIDG